MAIIVQTKRIDQKDKKVVQGDLVRVVLDGSGCGAPGCNCSPKNFITLSSGTILLTVELKESEAAQIRNTGVLELKSNA